MPSAILLFAEMIVALAVVSGVHALRRRTSLVFSYATVAWMTLASWVTPHAAVLRIAELQFHLESSVFFSAALVGVFLLYVVDGPRAGRMGMAVVIGTGLLYWFMAQLFSWQVAEVATPASELLPLASARANLASLIATLVDLVLLGMVWELCRWRPSSLRVFARVLTTLLVVLTADALVYTTLAWSGATTFLEILRGTLLTRVIVALLYAPLVTLYLNVEVRRHGLSLVPRPVLSILTREDLERELLSARHNLRIGTEALWESEERYRRMVDDMPIMVFRFSAEGIVTYANAALCEYYERPLSKILGLSVLLPVEQSEREATWKKITALTPQEPTVTLVARVFPRPGERRVQRWLIRCIFSPQGKGLAYQAVGEDITERTELESRLQQAQRMEGVAYLAGGVAHDFNNLLTVIWGCTEIVSETLTAERGEVPRGALSALEDIRHGADRAALLTQQLVAVSRREPTEPRRLDLSQVVGGIVPLLRRMMPQCVTLSVERGGELPPILADTIQIERVVINLVVNARDAMAEDGTITLLTAEEHLSEQEASAYPGARSGPHVLLTVRDTGQGMSPETLTRIFEPFFTTKQPGRGTGLGLSTVYSIAQQAGGHVRVESKEGVGTTFVVAFPALLDGPGPDSHPPPSTEPGPLILYCESDDVIRAQVVRLLESAAYRVAEFTSPGAVLEAAAKDGHRGPRVLLTDTVGAEMSGPQLAAAIRRHHPALPVVLFTGRVGTRQAPSVPRSGRDWYIPKPVQHRELLAVLEEAIRAS